MLHFSTLDEEIMLVFLTRILTLEPMINWISVTPMEFVASRLAPFRIREYRRLYFAQSLSWIGSWMQDMGKSWLVISQFGKGKEIGMLLFASALPVAMFSIKAGVFADRKNPKNILLVTQFSLFVSALLLATLAYFKTLEYWHLVFLAILEGLCVAYDAPAFQVMLPKLVGRENLQQTLALNSSSFHLSRILGPAIGGIILAALDVSAIFLINAFSFLLVSITVMRFRTLPFEQMHPSNVLKGTFKDFVGFLFKHAFFARILLQFLLVMTFVFPHTFSTLRLFIVERFNLDAKGFGILLTGPGLGAFLGSTILVVAKPKMPYKLFPFGLAGIIIFGFALLYCNNFWWMSVLLTLYTLSLFLYLSSLLVSLQIMIDHSFRGRLSSLVTLAFGAWAPAWSAVWGWLSDSMGSGHVFSYTLICFLALSLVLLQFMERFFPARAIES
jgi:MFS family permease